ncbi:MAG TPA: VOC family protein [Acidimicrobiia bacterium]|nr:VOC family protein [Acidimicrobiia bacterium]
MLTAVDHIVLQVSDLGSAIATYESLGFHVSPVAPSDAGDGSAYIVFDDFYLQLREVGRVEGLREVALRSDDLEAEAARVRSAGIEVSDIVDDPVDGDFGTLPRRRATVDLATRVGLVQHDHDPGARLAYLGGRRVHPNTATALERAYVAVARIERDLRAFESVFGKAAPEPEMGTVIMSLMSVFYFGDIGIAVAEPRGPGPTADALEVKGPGLFQVLFRGEHLDVAAGIITANGSPAPQRGTRLSGESALLNLPENACGAYVALAGPA